MRDIRNELIEEKYELDIKISDLYLALKHRSVPKNRKYYNVLKKQLKAMNSYEKILAERIFMEDVDGKKT
ncbi:MAG: hypothetical protein Ta2B_09540 [Termitinemataceae bacterium]|nr:MAG: hypothetical protein Ta2B_09540 [Termitinemataceae bacterium]